MHTKSYGPYHNTVSLPTAVSLSVVHMNNPNSTDLVSINIYGQVEDLKLDVDRSDTVNNSNWPSCEIDQAALKLIHMGSYPLEYYEISGECYQVSCCTVDLPLHK